MIRIPFLVARGILSIAFATSILFSSAAQAFLATNRLLSSHLLQIEMNDPTISHVDLESRVLSYLHRRGRYKEIQSFAELEKTIPHADQLNIVYELMRDQDRFLQGLGNSTLFNPKKQSSPIRDYLTARVKANLNKDMDSAYDWIKMNFYQDERLQQLTNLTLDELCANLSLGTQLAIVSRFPFIPQTSPYIEEAVLNLDGFLAKVRARIEAKLKGQPEAIDAVMAQIKQTMVKGFRSEKPDHIVLMGLPGTGKDTLAQAMVDGWYGYEDAWKEHMYALPVMKGEADTWKVLGSNTGFLGSGNLSPFIRWLVAHSSGRYMIVQNPNAQNGEAPQSIQENPRWRPGEVLPGYQAAEMSVVFVNEFHNWGKTASDMFLKQALEKGYFEINNPGGGINKLMIPVKFAIATNSGINLIASREANGQRFGPPLTYDQMLTRWQRSYRNKEALKRELARVNGSPNSGPSVSGGVGGAPGISEELLDRLNNLALLRPNSDSTNRSILLSRLREVQAQFAQSPFPGVRKIKLIPTRELLDDLLSYQFQGEQSSRTIEFKVKQLVEEPLIDALTQKTLLLNGEVAYLSIEKNEDGTRNLVVSTPDQEDQKFLIKFTLGDKKVTKITDADIDVLLTIYDRLSNDVVGAEEVKKTIAQRMLTAANRSRAVVTVENATEPAQAYTLLGLSSTGKNELAKSVSREVFKDTTAYELVDFSQVRTVRDVQERILGVRNGVGDCVPSPVMKAYDRLGGRLLLVLDEVSNAPADVLKALYDILREPVVRTFCDGVPRVMSNVMIVMTGNAGEEWFQSIPRDIPQIEQAEAMSQVYQEAMKDPDFQRSFLERKFSPALLNRMGRDSIFFMPPLGTKEVRQLSELKLSQELKRLQPPQEGQRAWSISFATVGDLSQMLDMIEDEGFEVWEQGASIDHYVKKGISKILEYELLTRKVADGAAVVLSKAPRKRATFNVTRSDTGEAFQIQFTQRKNKESKVMPPQEVRLVAYHEAGHELVSQAVFGDKVKPEKISIVPGVARINDQWIRYLGIAVHKEFEHYSLTREAVVARLSVLLAGEVAQALVTKGARHDAGKGNDIERATYLATLAILKMGLSDKWGRMAPSTGESIHDFVNRLTPERKALLESEVDKLLAESKTLARDVLVANFSNLLVPMANQLTEKGVVEGKDILGIYKQNGEPIYPYQAGFNIEAARESFETFFVTDYGGRPVPRDAEIIDGIALPRSVVDVEKLRQRTREAQRKSVPLMYNIPIGSVASAVSPPKVSAPQATSRASTSDASGASVRCNIWRQP